MSNLLSANVFLQGIWQPCRAENDLNDLMVIGHIPAELNGTFYRNGPNPQYVYSNRYHMFEGDGMLHALTFNNGKVNYKNRWIKTAKFLAEQKAGRGLFGGMRDFMACDDAVKTLSRNTANTSVISHHQKLLALNECAQPIEISAADLSTNGVYDFQQTLHRSMAAHPKIDPITGELIFYSYFSAAMDFQYFVADRVGKITHQTKLSMPYLSLMHDFAITEHYTIFPVFPLTWGFQRIMRGEMIFKWEPHLNTRFVIMPRYGDNEQMIQFEDQACLAMHVVNAYEEQDKIILEMLIADDIPADWNAFADDAVTYSSYLTRWTFDLKNKKITKQRMDNTSMEFPRLDERFIGRNNQYSYMTATLDKQLPKFFFDAVVGYNRVTNEKQMHLFDKNSLALEPIFVPRSSTAAEGEGFLLSYVYHQQEDRSDVVILNAQQVDDGPLATIQLPHRVPYGFHGCWVAA